MDKVTVVRVNLNAVSLKKKKNSVKYEVLLQNTIFCLNALICDATPESLTLGRCPQRTEVNETNPFLPKVSLANSMSLTLPGCLMSYVMHKKMDTQQDWYHKFIIFSLFRHLSFSNLFHMHCKHLLWKESILNYIFKSTPYIPYNSGLSPISSLPSSLAQMHHAGRPSPRN